MINAGRLDVTSLYILYNTEYLIQWERRKLAERAVYACHACIKHSLSAVASLGWVSPGVGTEGVTPIFSLEKLTTFLVITVCQFCGVTPIYFLLKN